MDQETVITAGERHVFQADVARLLHLMVHSIYSERDIFLRELISNSADACEKLRYEANSNPALISDGAPFAIKIALDPDASTLSVEDNGVGMSREDLALRSWHYRQFRHARFPRKGQRVGKRRR